ncbi:MAG: aldose 1-epimerase [Acidimicrobiales bacterium]
MVRLSGFVVVDPRIRRPLVLCMGALTLEADGVLAELDPAGGRLARLVVHGHDLLAPVLGERLQAGCYPMVPWAGRLGQGRFTFSGADYRFEPDMGPHKIHGLGTNITWDVAEAGTMGLDLHGHWPMGGVAQVVYSLDPASIACTLTITSGDQPIPVVLGWHPCFNRVVADNRAALVIEPGYMWERGPDHLPTGHHIDPPLGPWDDCFGGVVTTPSLTWGDGFGVRLESPTATWVVFDELDHLVCVEPQTDPPNAFNLGGGWRLEPGESLDLMLRIRWDDR